MKLAMTLMVRDEADIIGAMLEHHARQGIDVFIITDNASVDGTREIIEQFARDHEVDLRHDPEHRKQQTHVVTSMARDAATVHGADWVINADADEFTLPVDRATTLHEVFSQLPKSLGAFAVPVVNLTGRAARSGTGLDRLVYRDHRPDEELARNGIIAHPTPNAVHVGDPGVEVAQGNHFVSIPSAGSPPEPLAIEVLHLPWRSWDQYRRKVENAGRGYLNDSGLFPSPNHHGMREYRRLQSGLLFGAYLARHPDEAELAAGVAKDWYQPEDVIAREGLPGVPDELVDPREAEDAVRRYRETIDIEAFYQREHVAAESKIQSLERDVHNLGTELARMAGELDETRARAARAERMLQFRIRRWLSHRVARFRRR